MRPRRSRVLAGTALALALTAGAFAVGLQAQTTLAADATPLSLRDECRQALTYPGRTTADRAWLNQCVHALTAPTPTPTGPAAPPPIGPTATAPVTNPPTTNPPTSSAGTGFPTAGDTAAGSTGWRHTGVKLTLRTGLIRVRTGGTVIDSVEARDGIQVSADNVTIRRSLVEGGNSGPGAGIWIDAGVRGTVIEDVEVTSRPGADPSVESAVVDRAVTARDTVATVMRRVYAHRMIRGLEPGCDTLIEDSYVDGEVNPGGAHMSAIGTETCAEFRLTVRHNHVGLSPNKENSSALLYYPPQVGAYSAQHTTIAITDNYIVGGTYCLWLSSDPQFSGTVVVTGNRFGTEYYPNCGLYGPLFTDNLPREGHQSITWNDNRFTNGAVVNGPA